jgi:hypothetical protein
MAIPNGFWPLDLSVESLVLREMVPSQLSLSPRASGAWQAALARLARWLVTAGMLCGRNGEPGVGVASWSAHQDLIICPPPGGLVSSEAHWLAS